MESPAWLWSGRGTSASAAPPLACRSAPPAGPRAALARAYLGCVIAAITSSSLLSSRGPKNATSGSPCGCRTIWPSWCRKRPTPIAAPGPTGQVRLDHAAARSDLREARAAQGGQVSAAWSLAGAYAISAAGSVADSAAIPVIPEGLEPPTYALGKRRSDPAELWDLDRRESARGGGGAQVCDPHC